jgi:hypothetical protein
VFEGIKEQNRVFVNIVGNAAAAKTFFVFIQVKRYRGR